MLKNIWFLDLHQEFGTKLWPKRLKKAALVGKKEMQKVNKVKDVKYYTIDYKDSDATGSCNNGGLPLPLFR